MELLVNRRKPSRWLQVEMVGRAGNLEAIGGRVQVRARKDGPVQTGWVGENDTSRLSSGHYRLYFGLGGDKGRVRSVKVSWPDGGRTVLSKVRGDRLLHAVRP